MKVRQISLFEILDDSCFEKITDGKHYDKSPIFLVCDIVERLKNYDLEKYICDVENLGLEKTWNYICQFVIDNNGKVSDFLSIKNFGELYEIGLAIQDKIMKKRNGQYYTPDDVAKVMSNWLLECEGEAVCDVGCGTGKLILTYLELIGYKNARELISSGNLYLYDSDNIALKICRTTIAVKYGLDIADAINDIYCDFLDKSIILPKNCKVISNPPYAKIEEIKDYWLNTDVVLDTKQFYSAFMEKIINQAKSAVIITPFSFISSSKYVSLRSKLCDVGNGFIVSFDNVPGNIFCGRKHGIFNTNTSNSVRAAITVINCDSKIKGFRVSPLIRFKNEERKRLLKCNVLQEVLPSEAQIVDTRNSAFRKIDKSLIEIYNSWVLKSSFVLKDLISNDNTGYFIDMPNTCRYFTTACGRKLKRAGSITLNVKDKDSFNLVYCMINSSFTYWWWRIYDGGITYPIGLLNKMPVPLNLLGEEDKKFFANMTEKLLSEESNYIKIKMNSGKEQENIKFPKEYRNQINERILNILGYQSCKDIFENVHANCFFWN